MTHNVYLMGVIALLSMLVPALTNRVRGGLFNLPGGTARGINAVAFGLVAFGATGLFLPALLVIPATLAGQSWGWGSYYDIGRNPDGYRDEPEVSWIDWLLHRIYGPQWVPTGLWNEVQRPYTLPSPTGDVRPLAWRKRRDFMGMVLRGLLWSIFLMLAVLPSVLLGDLSPAALWIVTDGALMALVYAIAHDEEDRHPNSFWWWNGRLSTGPTDAAEIMWGAALGLFLFANLALARWITLGFNHA